VNTSNSCAEVTALDISMDRVMDRHTYSFDYCCYRSRCTDAGEIGYELGRKLNTSRHLA
jgi:hypothetical protein